MLSYVTIPKHRGRLYLHPMPGLHGEPLEEFLEEIREAVVSRIICLPEEKELRILAPYYYKAIVKNTAGRRACGDWVLIDSLCPTLVR